MLSHSFSQRGDEFIAADRPAFDNARDHPRIRQDARVHQSRLVEKQTFQRQRRVFRPASVLGRRFRNRVRRGRIAQRFHAGGTYATCVGRVFRGWWPDSRWRRVDITRRSVFGVISGLAAFAVETFLVPSALGRSIVLSAPLVGAMATMVLPAAEGAAEILAARVAGMSKEANPAVAATHRAGP